MPEPRPEAFLELSADLTVVDLSSGAEQLYALERSSTLGKPLVEVILNDAGRIDWAEHLRAVRAASAELGAAA